MCLTIEQFEKRLIDTVDYGWAPGPTDLDPSKLLWRHCRDKVIRLLFDEGLWAYQIARIWISDLYRDTGPASVLVMDKRLSRNGIFREIRLGVALRVYLAQLYPQLPLIREVESIHAIRRCYGGPALTLGSIRRILKNKGDECHPLNEV